MDDRHDLGMRPRVGRATPHARGMFLGAALGLFLALSAGAAPLQAPPNDDLADAIVITALPFEDAQTTSQASEEPDEEPASCGDGSEHGVWYRYTAAESGVVMLSTDGSDFDTVVSVWVGAGMHPLEEVACNDDAGGFTSLVVFSAEAGTDYYLKAGGLDGERGRLMLRLESAPPAPVNDDLVDAVEVVELPFGDSVAAFGASDEADEVRASCAPSDGPELGLWYRLTLEADMVAILSARGSGSPAPISAWRGARPEHGSLTEIACAGSGELTLELGAGEPVYIKVGAPEGASILTFLAVEAPPAPAHDDLASALPIEALPFTDVQPMWATRDEPGEASASCAEPGQSERAVWYRDTAPADMRVILETVRETLPAVLSAWSEGSMHPLTELACGSWNAERGRSRVEVSLIEGQTVLFKAGPLGDAVGWLMLEIGMRPANDALADATVVDALPYAEDLAIRWASLEPDELTPSCAPPPRGGEIEGSVWLRYTPVAAATLVITSSVGSASQSLSLWRGEDGHPLSEVACAANSKGGFVPRILVTPVVSGEAVYVRVGALDTDFGASIQVAVAPPPPLNDDLAAALPIDAGALPFSDRRLAHSATSEAGEVPASCGGAASPERGLWYRLVVEDAGPVVLATRGSVYDTVLSVWSEAGGHPLVELGCNDDVSRDAGWPGQSWSYLRLDAEAGRPYYVKVSGRDGASGPMSLTVAYPPANDDLADAMAVTELPFVDTQVTWGAGDEPDEAADDCEGVLGGVWHRYTAAEAGRLLLTTEGSDFDTVISAWSDGTSHPLDLLACSDDVSYDSWSRLVLDLAAEETVLIKVSGFSGSAGRFVFAALPAPPPPANDDLAAAVEIVGPLFTDQRETYDASDEPSEAQSSCGEQRGVWYRYVSARSGPVAFSTLGSDFDTVLSVWVDGPEHPLTELDCNDDGDGTWSYIELDAEAGQTYYVKAAGFDGDVGRLVFGIHRQRIYLPLAVRR